MPKTLKLTKGPRSWSSIETYDTCKLKFRFRYIDRVPIAKHMAAAFGSAFHDFRYRYYSHCEDQNVDSDWDSVNEIATKTFHDHDLPMERWEEFYYLCKQHAENRPYNSAMGIEVRFGVNRDGKWAPFDDCDYFRGIVDGFEVRNEVGTITDSKTTMKRDLPFTQLKIYAAFFAIRYPEVQTWRLVYDFARFGKLDVEDIPAENLQIVRRHVKAKIQKMEAETQWKPEPGEHCRMCPYISMCKYKLQGLKVPRKKSDVSTLMQEFYYYKSKAEQMKRTIREWVESFGTVVDKRHTAAFFQKEKKEVPDKAGLVKLLKAMKRNPLNYLEFPAASIKKLMKDKEIDADALSPYIFIDHVHEFDIKKTKGEEE